MEVHHHPDIHHKSKKWKEYFFEFLMIFLAVTMGFFAENIREYLGENKKEIEYVKELIEDFRTDTARINIAIKYNDRTLFSDSSLIRLLYGNKTDSANLRKIYLLYPNTLNFDQEFFDSRTFDLLKNTGDLKLIKNKITLKKVSAYYRLISMEKLFSNEIQAQLVNTYNFSEICFDYYSFKEFPSKQISLATTDEGTIKEYANKLYMLSNSLAEYKRHLLIVKSEASELIKTAKMEYHLNIK